MSNALITVADLAQACAVSPLTVQKWARKHGVGKASGVYIFTQEQAEAFRQRKRTPGPAQKPEGEITHSAKSRRKSRKVKVQ